MIVVLVSPLINSCKKGDGDPFISFRSRESRLKGEWNLTSGTETGTNGSIPYSKIFTETTVTVTTGGISTTSTHTEKLEFLKDNVYKGTKMNNGVISTTDGFWAFMDGYDQIKNKECVVLRFNSQTNGSTITNYTGDDMPMHILRFNKLSNSEAIIEVTGTVVGSSTNTSTSTKTYAKK